VRVAALHVFEIALYEVLVCCGMNDVVYGLLGVLCILNPWISPHSLIIGCFSALRLRVSHFEGPSRHLAPAVNAVYVLELLVCICWCRAPHSACTISRSP